MRTSHRQTATAGALAALLALVSGAAVADEFYLCDGVTAHVVVPTNAQPKAAQHDPCVRAHHVMRKREAIHRPLAHGRMSELFHPDGAPTGVTTGDFCGPGEPCHKPLPRWRRRWNYDDPPSSRTLYFRHLFERY